MDHVPSSNTTLLFLTLIIIFLSATFPSLLSQVACPFQKRITNRVRISKQSGFIAGILGGKESSFHTFFFHGSMGLCGLDSIRCVLLSMAKDKKIFTIIEWVYITPHSSVYSRHSYFLWGCKKQPSIYFPFGKKIHNFDIN